MANMLKVVGPCVLATDENRKVHYFYDGSLVPFDLDDDQRERLLGTGLVVEVDKDGNELENQQADETSISLAAPQVSVLSATEGSGERPKQTAPQSAWVDYAVTRGLSRSEASQLSKAELIDRLK